MSSLFLLSLASFVTILGSWIVYMKDIPKMKVQETPVGNIIAQGLGLGMAITAIIMAISRAEPGSFVIFLPAAFSLLPGTAFFYLYSLRKTPVGGIKVQRGDTILPFTAKMSDGSVFNSDVLAGQRVLLKFFRGAW